MDSEQIGWLQMPHVYCDDCWSQTLDKDSWAKLFRVNIAPYGQTCHNCGLTLVKARPGWPQLFAPAMPSATLRERHDA